MPKPSRNTPRHLRGDRSSSSARQTPPPRQKIEFTKAVPRLAPPADFLEQAAAYGIDFEPGEIERYGHYLALLLANNALLNLTAITEPGEAWRRHILDSLTLLPLLEADETPRETPSDGGEAGTLTEPPDEPPPSEIRRVCDIGSGGGAPGLVLAIARPDIEFTLVESTAKKAEFLEAAIGELALTNARVINARAEEVGAHVPGQGPVQRRGAPSAPTQLGLLHRGFYDLVTARAVGRIAIIAEWCIPLLRIAGRAALIKGEKASEELAEAKQALHLLHAHHIATIDTPTGKIVVLEKMRKTPALYPRKPGEARRRPLGVDER
ncbi:MAG: 16S rRNA (guanine(527)-N(7))-methyltransferase RsmG [Phycisphaerales bacterium]